MSKYNVLAVVVNNVYTADIFLAKYIDASMHTLSSFSDKTPLENLDLGDSLLTAWSASSEDGAARINMSSQTMVSNMINVIRIPFAALAFTIIKDRALNNTDNRYAIVSIKEAVNTQAVKLSLYDMFVDTKFVPDFDLIMEYFNTESNPLFDSRFDPVIEMVKNNKIPCMSPFTKKYL